MISNNSNATLDLEKGPPHDPHVEKAILGSIILDNTRLFQVIDLLEPEDFYVPSFRQIYMAALRLFANGQEINSVLLAAELRTRMELESVGGISGITNLTYGLPHFADITQYATIVKSKSLLRQLVKANARSTAEALEGDSPTDVVLANAESGLFALTRTRHRTKLTRVGEQLDTIVTSAQGNVGHSLTANGLSTGLVDLDDITSGLQPGDLILIAARPSMGKTSLAQSIVNNVGIRGENKVVAFFSLEMSKDIVIARMLCSEARVDLKRFRLGILNHEEWDRLAVAQASLNAARIFIDDTPAITVLETRSKAMQLAAEIEKPDLLVIDYLQLMTGATRRAESRQQEVSQISRELKALAKELNVPLVALSQLSRSPEARQDKRPILSDLRESGALEQDADVVAFIYREAAYQPGLSPENQRLAELIVAKQRNGPTGTVNLHFDVRLTRFDNLDLGL
jgi:replicative DNA helicase